MTPIIVLWVSFFIFLILRIPIPFSIGLSTVITLIYGGLPPILLVQHMYRGLQSFPLLAIPLFMLAAQLMNVGDITNRLISVSNVLVGRFRGGLGLVNVVVSMLFGGISGSSVADVSGIGGVLIPAMIRNGYDRRFTVGITVASSTLGVIIPPSINMVVYGALGNVSIAALFLGGAVPGVLIGLFQIIIVIWYARKKNLPKGDSINLSQSIKIIIQGVPPLLMPLIIIGGIVGGIFSATEAASVAVVYAILISVLIFNKLNISKFCKGISLASDQIGPVLLCVSTASAFGWLMAYYEVPELMESFVNNLSLSPEGILFSIAIIFLISTTFMGSIPCIIMYLPIVARLGNLAGAHPVQVGIIVSLCLSIGLISIPYGLCTLVGAKIGRISVIDALIATSVFAIPSFIILVLIIFFPEIVLFLPKLLVPDFL